MQHVIFKTSLKTLVTHGKNRKKTRKETPFNTPSHPPEVMRIHIQFAQNQWSLEFTVQKEAELIFTVIKQGGKTGPCGVPSSTHLVQNYHTSLLKYTRTRWLWTSAKPAKATFDLRWWEKGGRHACNPVRATPARLKWVPVAVLFWLGGIGKWICLQSHSQMNTGR